MIVAFEPEPREPNCNLLTLASSGLNSKRMGEAIYCYLSRLGSESLKPDLQYSRAQNSEKIFALQTANTVLLPAPKRSVFGKMLLYIF